MEWWQAVVLGIVEGLTEYLPVSSTGHLLVTQRAMGIPESDASAAYAICIQAGAIVAILGLYWQHVAMMLRGIGGALGLGEKNRDGLRLATNIIAGFLPAAVIGLLFDDLIKEHLFGGGRWDLWPIIVAWAVGGVAILVVVHRRKKTNDSNESNVSPDDRSDTNDNGKGNNKAKELTDLTWQLAMIIGFAQCLAMWPGVSRSLVTIVGGVLVGMRLVAAVEFSFLLGVVTLGAATCYDALKHGETMIDTYGVGTLVIGFIFAFVSAVIAVKWMVSFLQRRGLAVFGYYRIAAAVIVGGLLLSGLLRSAA